MLRRILLITSSLISLTFAEDGKTLYGTYCAACHAPDGKGASNGAFPPLAQSLWVQGKPDRSIQIVLHGLTGNIEVTGKNYNLQMPPQGSVLNDDQLASILTYVRSSWGNKAPAVTPAQVATVRTASTKRKSMWTAPELLKLHPLPTAKSPIKNLIRTTYEGKWKKLPDFSKLESTSVEEEHHGLLNLENIAVKDNFGVVWEGELEVPANGTYRFLLDSDDGSALYLDGEKIIELNSLGSLYSRTQAGKIKLRKGTIPIRVEYFELANKEDIILYWSGPGITGRQWMSVRPRTKRKPAPVIDLTPTGEKSAIYNNFINNTTPRAISIGHPNGANYAFSTKNCAMSILWSGKFINAGQHWTSRGVGRTKPLGKNVAILGDSAFITQHPPQFRGYTLDKLRRPTFEYTIKDTTITDAIMPGESENTLIRTLTIKGNQTLLFNAAIGIPVAATNPHTYTLGGKWQLKTATNTKLIHNKDSLILQLAPGTHTLTYSLLP